MSLHQWWFLVSLCNTQQFIITETEILRMLELRVAVQSINWIDQWFITVMSMTDEVKCLSLLYMYIHWYTCIYMYLFVSQEVLVYWLSTIAVSTIVIASVFHVQTPWPRLIQQISSYFLYELKPSRKWMLSQCSHKEATRSC